MPPAPGLFSTTTGWPRILLALSARTRMVMSVGPGGDHQLDGLDGKLWARAVIVGAAGWQPPLDDLATLHGGGAPDWQNGDAHCTALFKAKPPAVKGWETPLEPVAHAGSP